MNIVLLEEVILFSTDKSFGMNDPEQAVIELIAYTDHRYPESGMVVHPCGEFILKSRGKPFSPGKQFQ